MMVHLRPVPNPRSFPSMQLIRLAFAVVVHVKSLSAYMTIGGAVRTVMRMMSKSINYVRSVAHVTI